MSLSIVLPCYHPPEGWDQRIIAVYKELKAALPDFSRLIIVDDGNGKFLPEAALAVLRTEIPILELVRYQENRGKGYALRQGVTHADGEVIIYTDIDFPYSTESLLSVYRALATDECDVAAGIKNEAYYTHVPRARRIISKNLRAMIRFFLRMPVTDTQCGLKGFRQKVKPVFLQTSIDRYLFDLEFLHSVFKHHKELRVKAIPVQLNPGVIFRKMNYKILFPEIMNFIRLLFK